MVAALSPQTSGLLAFLDKPLANGFDVRNRDQGASADRGSMSDVTQCESGTADPESLFNAKGRKYFNRIL